MKLGLCASMLLLVPTGASAALFQNGSFETGAFVDNTGANTDRLDPGSTAMTGWTVVGGGNIAWEKNGNPYSATASDGSYALDLTGYADTAPYGGVSQTFDTIVGHVYSLSFDVGNNSGNPASGATVGASINGTQIYAFNNNTPSASGINNNFRTGSTSFTAMSASTQLQLLGIAGGSYIGLDNVRVVDTSVSAAVPEPSTWALMMLGFGGMSYAMRRKNKVSTRIRFA